MNRVTDFFLSAQTPMGFISGFDSLLRLDKSWKCFILKGSPGCGKSTVFKKIAEKACNKYEYVERIHCSCDTDCLDGVIIWDIHKVFIDGTAPHNIEPVYPEANHIVISLYEGCDRNYLWENREKIMEITDRKQLLSQKCRHMLMSTGEFYHDSCTIAQSFTDISKIYAQTHRIIKKELRPVNPYGGKESLRFLSVLNGKGVTVFPDTITALADKVYLLQDEYGAFSEIMLSAIRNHALYCGYDIITCYCSAGSWKKPEHIFIPELKLAFVSSNQFHRLNIEPYRIINSRRYTDNTLLRENRKHLSFNKRSTAQILEKSTDIMREICSLHNELENIYSNAVDYKRTDAVKEILLDEI